MSLLLAFRAQPSPLRWLGSQALRVGEEISLGHLGTRAYISSHYQKRGAFVPSCIQELLQAEALLTLGPCMTLTLPHFSLQPCALGTPHRLCGHIPRPV